ncbi:MAG: hypothetical protein ACYS0G_11140 [Planctomycetota bacterium]|jgi:hypothetical protein
MPKRRTAFLLVGFPVYLAVLMAISSLLWPLLAFGPSEAWDTWSNWLVDGFPWVDDPGTWMLGVLPGLLIGTTQYLFLAPIVPLRVGLQPKGRPLLLSLVGAGIVAAAGTTALILALTDVAWLVWRNQAREYDSEWTLFGVMLGVLACSWLIWTPVLVAFSRRRPHRTTAGRLAGLLLGGTMAELVVIIPVDILVRYRNTCYCTTASFHATWLASLMLLWLAGPGLFFALTSRRRRAWLENHCANCGYPQGPSPGPQCPECGYAWRDGPAAPAPPGPL